MNGQLNILCSLARSDGEIDPQELDFLYKIGEKTGVSREQVNDLLEHPSPIDHLSELTEYQKFECVCHLVQLMKADQKVTDPEILFARKMAIRLGYDPEVIRAVFTRLDQDPELRTKPDSLFNMVSDFAE